MRTAWEQNYQLRQTILKNRPCAACGSRENLHTHHKHYKTVGCEQVGDVVTLCEYCHGLFHTYVKGSDLDLEEMTNLFIRGKLAFYKKVKQHLRPTNKDLRMRGINKRFGKPIGNRQYLG